MKTTKTLENNKSIQIENNTLAKKTSILNTKESNDTVDKLTFYKQNLLKDKFINLLMFDGKKSVATRVFFASLLILKQKYLKDFHNEAIIKVSKNKESTLSSIIKTKLSNKQKEIVENLNNSLDKSITESLSKNSNKSNSNRFLNSLRKETIKENISVLDLMSKAVENVAPSVEVRKVRRGANTLLVPAILSDSKANNLAIRWIIESARKKQEASFKYSPVEYNKTNFNINLSFAECLADELYQAYSKQGKARQKREELHTVATNNRANIRFRWW